MSPSPVRCSTVCPNLCRVVGWKLLLLSSTQCSGAIGVIFVLPLCYCKLHLDLLCHPYELSWEGNGRGGLVRHDLLSRQSLFLRAAITQRTGLWSRQTTLQLHQTYLSNGNIIWRTSLLFLFIPWFFHRLITYSVNVNNLHHKYLFIGSLSN